MAKLRGYKYILLSKESFFNLQRKQLIVRKYNLLTSLYKINNITRNIMYILRSINKSKSMGNDQSNFHFLNFFNCQFRFLYFNLIDILIMIDCFGRVGYILSNIDVENNNITSNKRELIDRIC